MEKSHHLHNFDKIIYKSKCDALSEIYSKHICPGEIFIAYYLNNNKIRAIIALSANGHTTIIENNDEIKALIHELSIAQKNMSDKIESDNYKHEKDIDLLNQDIANINNDIQKQYSYTQNIFDILSLQIYNSQINQEANINQKLSWELI